MYAVVAFFYFHFYSIFPKHSVTILGLAWPGSDNRFCSCATNKQMRIVNIQVGYYEGEFYFVFMTIHDNLFLLL